MKHKCYAYKINIDDRKAVFCLLLYIFKKYDESVDRREDRMIFCEHYRTPCEKKVVTRVQVVTASQVQTNGCRLQAILSCP